MAKQINLFADIDMQEVAWFSCGVTSAIACYLALKVNPNVRIIYIHIDDAHPDNERFIADCERWYGKKIEIVKSDKYDSVDEVLESGYINGPTGAKCTTELKKEVRMGIERRNNITAQYFGFEFVPKQINRAIRFLEKYAHINPKFILIDNRLTKNECAGMLLSAGIALPVMYLLGFENNNCIGCVKGGKGYWNRIRIYFIDVFNLRAKRERLIGHSCIKGVFLDELDPEAGKDTVEIIPECGAFCQSEFADIEDKRTALIMDGLMTMNDILKLVA